MKYKFFLNAWNGSASRLFNNENMVSLEVVTFDEKSALTIATELINREHYEVYKILEI